MTWLALYIYRLPVTLFLKNHLHLGAETVSVFMFLTLMAWNFKPLAGLISDCFPFMGTRRRHYLMFAAFFCGLSWLLILILPKTYTLLLWLLIFMNVFLVMCSTVLGGLLVEVGQKFRATGRLTAHRTAMMNLAVLVSGPFGGYLAGRAFGWTAGLCAGLLFCLVPMVCFFLKEKANTERNPAVWRDTGKQLKVLIRSKPLWWGVGMNVLLNIQPGFGTPLLYFQQGDLHFSEQFIGNLGFISGGCGILGAMAYSRICRTIRLGPLMYAGVICSAISSFVYLGYWSASAAWIIEGCNGLFCGIITVVLYNLSARAAPHGCEALAYSLMMASGNLALSIGDVVGSWMYEHWHWKFMDLVWLNGSTTLLILFVLPFLPRVLMDGRDGDHEAVI